MCNINDLENSAYTKYLGVTLDRTLSYKDTYRTRTEQVKVATHNKLMWKLQIMDMRNQNQDPSMHTDWTPGLTNHVGEPCNLDDLHQFSNITKQCVDQWRTTV